MDSVTFTKKYPAGHTYEHTWELTGCHCPVCGKQEVWHDTSDGDYYVGEQHMCMACKAKFYLPMTTTGPLDVIDQQTFDAILSATTSEGQKS